MKLYERYAAEIAELIRSQVLRPGERLPSVRQARQKRRRGWKPRRRPHKTVGFRGAAEARRFGFGSGRGGRGTAQPRARIARAP